MLHVHSHLWLLVVGVMSTASHLVVVEAGVLSANSAEWELVQQDATDTGGTIAVTVALALPDSHVKAMLTDLDRTSDPLATTYGKHRWTFERLQKQLAPAPAALSTVREWLVRGGATIESVTANGGFVKAWFGRADAERWFGVQLRRYVHKTRGTESLCSAGPYSVPSEIAPLVEFVAGLTRLPTYRRSSGGVQGEHSVATAVDTAASLAAFTVTPALLRQLYALPSKPLATAGNLQVGVVVQARCTCCDNRELASSDLSCFQLNFKPGTGGGCVQQRVLPAGRPRAVPGAPAPPAAARSDRRAGHGWRLRHRRG